ncbi:MAG TPA: OmpA family protein [Polyangia bacterium]|nr:OmpA family protein [Polyangia bacterium]
MPFLILSAPCLALAQPADDPGLSEAPPPPKPAPPKPAAVTPATTPTSSTTSTITSTESPPNEQLSAPDVHESVDEQVTWKPGTGEHPPDEDMYETVAAPSLTGGVGLFRTLEAESGKTNTFRVGINLQAFRQSNFLIAGSNGVGGDTNSRFLGNLTIGYTPWKYLELYLGIFNSSNQNTRTDSGREDPEVILALGDVAAGVKGHVPLAAWFDLGVNLGLKFFNSVSKVSVEGAATNFTADLLGSFDLRHAEATKNVPLRFHINVGYLVDESIKLLAGNGCPTSTSNDACIRSRVVETFGYGIGASRFRIATAADVPLEFKKAHVGLELFAEYHAEIAVGDGDQTIVRALANDSSISNSRLTGTSLQYFTFGARVRPVAGLVLDAGIDVGLSSPGFQYGPPVPAWNVILGASYVYDPIGARGRTKVVTRTITRESARSAVEGKLRGFVRDGATKKPIGGATIRYTSRRATPQLTADDGSFLSYGFPPGPITLEISRDDYEPAKIETSIPANGETPLEVLLKAKPPQNGLLHGKVTDSDGNGLVATVRLTNPQTGAIVDAEPEGGSGGYGAKLPQGDYAMEVSADGYLSKQRQITIVTAQPTSFEVVLRKKPLTSHVSLGKGEIIIKGVIHFGTNNAEIRPDGAELLDEVADVLVKHGEIRRIRVEGHTDNRGNADKNLELSKARAAAVVAYLVKQGIDPARLESEGFGSTQPLVPNITPAQRAKNRRVAFKILDGGSVPSVTQ